jgi:NADH-quinone oxidoreductase subunit C
MADGPDPEQKKPATPPAPDTAKPAAPGAPAAPAASAAPGAPAPARPAAPAKPRIDPVEEKLRRPVESAALDALREAFPDSVLDVVCYAGEVTVVVPRQRVGELLRFLHDDARTAFDLLTDLTAVDWPKREQRFDVVYHLYSVPRNHRLRLRSAWRKASPSPPAPACTTRPTGTSARCSTCSGSPSRGTPTCAGS